MKENNDKRNPENKETKAKLLIENRNLKRLLEECKKNETSENSPRNFQNTYENVSENEYRNLFNKLPASILLFDKDLTVLDMNTQCRIMLGLESDEIRNFKLDSVFEKEIVRQFENSLSGNYGYYEGVNKKASSIYFSNITVQVRPHTFNLHGKEIKGGIAVFDDISEQRLSEIAVNLSFDTLQTVLDNVDAMMYVVDPENFNVKYMNRQAVVAFGKNHMSKCSDFFSETAKPPCRKCSIANPSVRAKNFSYRTHWEYYDERKTKWYRYSANPMTWIDSTQAVLIVVSDITIQKKADIKIKEQNKELASQTNELEHVVLQMMEQNVRINNQADELMLSAQTKDKMFSIIGHDLRGPIGNIRNILEIILEDFDTYSSEEIKDFLKPVKDTAKSAHNLLSNLLYWARSQSGMIVQSREEFWINESVHENITLPASDTENKNISIFFDDSHDFLVYADENMVNTVLRNLISNAVKFTFPGGKITIQIKQSEKNNLPFVEISIRDTGKGIEEENLCKLFNNREHYTTFGTNNEKGSGLGLILCKEFIELMGGEIFVESEVLKGSNFIFTLPVHKQ